MRASASLSGSKTWWVKEGLHNSPVGSPKVTVMNVMLKERIALVDLPTFCQRFLEKNANFLRR